MAINFKASVIAGTRYMADTDHPEFATHSTREIESDLDLGNHRVMRNIESYSSQDGMGNHLFTGAEAIQWLNEINTFQGNLAKLYIEQLMTYYATPVGYVSVLITWC